MRTVRMLLLLILGCSITDSIQAAAQLMDVAIDDDCPTGCQAQVLFHPSHNGTANAFRPNSTPKIPRPCLRDQPCTVCADSEDNSCVTTVYGGPYLNRGVLRFSPAFFDQQCASDPLAEALLSICLERARAGRYLMQHLNCFQHPNHPKCVTIMKSAKYKKAKDLLYYQDCLEQGEFSYNRHKPRILQRSENCTMERFPSYSANGGAQVHLLPGACPGDSYVGLTGQACCTGDPIRDGNLKSECEIFYPSLNEIATQ